MMERRRVRGCLGWGLTSGKARLFEKFKVERVDRKQLAWQLISNGPTTFYLAFYHQMALYFEEAIPAWFLSLIHI